MNVKQRQLSENEKLLQSLRTEIKVYEKLEEAKRKRTGINAQGMSWPMCPFPLSKILSKDSTAGSLFLCFCSGLLCKAEATT